MLIHFLKKQCNLKNKSSNPYFQFKMVAVSMAYSFFSFREKYPNFLILRYFYHFFIIQFFFHIIFFLILYFQTFYFLSFFIFCFPKVNCIVFSPVFSYYSKSYFSSIFYIFIFPKQN